MTKNDDIKHNLMLNVKRLEGILERIDKYCHNYDQEKENASVRVKKIKRTKKKNRKIKQKMSKEAEKINKETNKKKEEKD